MLKKYTSILAVLILAFFSGNVLSKTYDNVYVFGDSLSDTGNLAAAIGSDLPTPPYFQNRITNGQVAVEALSHKLGLKLEPSYYFLGIENGTNYAVAGASAAEEGPIPEPQNLQTQIGAFLYNHMWSAPSDSLYVVFIGGNDVRHARGELNPFDPTDLTAAQGILNEAATIVAGAVDTLIQRGAQHILVVNAPNIGAIPETRMVAEAYGLPWLPGVTAGLTEYFNIVLEKSLQFVEAKNAMPVARFDLYSAFSSLLANAHLLDISNTTDACYLTHDNQLFPIVNPLCLDSNLEADPNSFFFIDEIHPTKSVHKAIGKAMADTIK